MSPPHVPPERDRETHLTESALTAAADGEDALPPAAEAHLARCEACTARLVELAHASILAREMLELAHPAPLRAPSRLVSIPWRAVAAALCISVVSVSPLLYHLPALLARVAPALLHGVPVLARGLLVALSSRGPSATLATLLSSFLLILVGITVSRVFRHSGALS